MNDHFDILNENNKSIVIKKLSELLDEKEELILKLYPVWNSIVLASILRLSRNRIRFSALQNFIQKDTFPAKELALFSAEESRKYSVDAICRYGETLMGVLIPDKKSALANSMSNDLVVRGSLILKGLSVIYALYGEFLSTEGGQLLNDWKSFVEYFGAFKNNIFDSTVPIRAQKSISEILILAEIYKDPQIIPFSEESEINIVSSSEKQGFWIRYRFFILVFILISSVITALFWYSTPKMNDDKISKEDIEVIPDENLSKLSDSLTKSVLDSNRITSDSIRISWPKGKEFSVSKTSILVKIHEYLNDSTQIEGFQSSCNEISFDKDSDQIISGNDYFFMRLVEGLNRYRNIKIRLYTFSEKGYESALKRGFLLKNRMVGEGLSPKRIEVKVEKNQSPELDVKGTNEQFVLELIKL